ncbi:MAG: GDSL family lipase [Acidobacteria bacterium]|nr:GDSL family lipase [Acidobacteriota bacterium]
MKNPLRLILFVIVISQFAYAQVPAPTPRFAEQIEAFLKADETNQPPQGGILFIGSSIFRQWKKLPQQMAPLPVFNRAFGGSRTDEVLFYLDQIVLPYQPKIIVYYCGSNDINVNAEPEHIATRFKQFVERVRAKLPQTRIYFVSINRAPQKMDKWKQVDATNAMIRSYCEAARGLGYIDVNRVLFDKRRQPRYDLYLPDKLHFTDKAYELFTPIIKPVIAKAWRSMKVKTAVKVRQKVRPA